MPFFDVKDPRDPWAFRNTWTGEIRNSYEDLWIIIPLIVCLLIIALLMILPLFIHMYCRSACPCKGFFRWFDRFLLVLHNIGREKVLRNTKEYCFENPTFNPATVTDLEQNRPEQPKNIVPSHLRSSVRYYKKRPTKQIRRSRSLPNKPKVPRIKI
ncbi:hypothetical protein M3Y97_00601300 [Aphelenchoides bicaudatus]|nr:hypothetical protein M3Y97_00601300 [Aphelenchoides bicaudatus]